MLLNSIWNDINFLFYWYAHRSSNHFDSFADISSQYNEYVSPIQSEGQKPYKSSNCEVPFDDHQINIVIILLIFKKSTNSTV